MLKTILSAALLLALTLACSSEPEKVTMGTEGYYHPYNFINDDGEVDGFERELGDRAMPPRRPRMRLGHQRTGTPSSPTCRPVTTTPSWPA